MQAPPVWLRIWQQNLNKLRIAQEDLINSDIHKNYDVLILQEPYIDAYGNTKAMRCWHVVYASSWRMDSLLPRAVVFVSTALDTNQWSQIHIPNTRDMVAVQVTGEFGSITIYNVYMACDSAESIKRLGGHMASRWQGPQPTGDSYTLWGGDFNHHHPMWDEERNSHLFTAAALREADKLLALVADYGMEMLLPKDIPTLEVMATKNWTRPDNVFSSDNLGDKVIYCTTDP